MEVKPPMARGVIEASAPPATMTSAYPSRMWRKASPSALLPPAQAATGEMHIPCRPKRMAMCPAARLEMAMGMKKGETLSKPRLWPDSQQL